MIYRSLPRVDPSMDLGVCKKELICDYEKNTCDYTKRELAHLIVVN